MKYLIFTKRHLVMFVSVILAITCLSVIAFAKTTNNNKLLPIYSVGLKSKEIAITFDAAWGNEDTDEILNILESYNVKATFFLVGGWVSKYPQSVKKIASHLHEIGNHSNTHPDFTKLDETKILEEIKSCNLKIKNIIGKSPKVFRPPFGAYNNQLISSLKSLKMQTIQWDVDSCDWMEGMSAQQIETKVLKKVKPGSIILFHNAAINTPAALPNILEDLISKGYTFKTVSELIYNKNYVINNQGVQIKKDGA